jgi:hypothetical protein
VRTVLVTVLVVVTVATGAFGLQAAGLRPPAPANRVAARAARWLLGYRYATSTIDVRGTTITGRCFHGWFAGRPGSTLERGTLLTLSNGGSIRTLRTNRIVARRSFMPAAIGALEVAGCTDVLGPRLSTLAEFDAAMRVKRAWLDGRRVLALHAHKLIILVAPQSDRPVGVLLHGVKSRLQLRRLTPELVRRLEAA